MQASWVQALLSISRTPPQFLMWSLPRSHPLFTLSTTHFNLLDLYSMKDHFRTPASGAEEPSNPFPTQASSMPSNTPTSPAPVHQVPVSLASPKTINPSTVSSLQVSVPSTLLLPDRSIPQSVPLLAAPNYHAPSVVDTLSIVLPICNMEHSLDQETEIQSPKLPSNSKKTRARKKSSDQGSKSVTRKSVGFPPKEVFNG